jgi:hypothetical protein
MKKTISTINFELKFTPIALLLNDHYLEVSNDVTQDIRNNGARDRILQLTDQRIVTNAIKNFTVVSCFDRNLRSR